MGFIMSKHLVQSNIEINILEKSSQVALEFFSNANKNHDQETQISLFMRELWTTLWAVKC